MAEYRTGVRSPSGFEDACEPNEYGWPIWTRRADGSPPCAHDACEAPYDDEEPAMALECPSCDRPGCHSCMPDGRGCVCPECQEAEEDDDG